MDAVTLIEKAQSIGLVFLVDGDKLSITGPKTMAAAGLVQQMAPFKADIIAALAPQPAQRPPLPSDLWITGIATFAEARQAQKRLSGEYKTACGMGDTGFYVAAPYSGVCAVHVPYGGGTGDFELVFGEKGGDMTTDTGVKYLGTEEYTVRRYGTSTYSYYLDGNIIERRTLQSSGDTYVVWRYLSLDEQSIDRVSNLIASVDGKPQRTDRKHREIDSILHKFPGGTAYISADEIDNKDRRVMVASYSNIRDNNMIAEFDKYFTLGCGKVQA